MRVIAVLANGQILVEDVSSTYAAKEFVLRVRQFEFGDFVFVATIKKNNLVRLELGG